MMEHKHEEVRMSMRLDQLKSEQLSKQEIETKQKELDAIMTKHRADQESLMQLRAKLQEKVNNEAIFAQQKIAARNLLYRQEQENKQLREQNERLMRAHAELQRQASEQL